MRRTEARAPQTQADHSLAGLLTSHARAPRQVLEHDWRGAPAGRPDLPLAWGDHHQWAQAHQAAYSADGAGGDVRRSGAGEEEKHLALDH